MFKHILLATDGSAASENAARLAIGLARGQGAKLTAVYVVDPFPYLGIADTNPMGLHAYLSAARDHAAAAHARVAALCKETANAPLEPQLRLVEDVPAAKGILRTALDEGADLIVTGSHGRGGIEGLLLGSVAARVVARSTVPVLVAR
jgi:nucleotide-binding universal stress UspA family protein